MRSARRPASVAVLAALLVMPACRAADGADDGTDDAAGTDAVRIERVMADPRDVPDEQGEWFMVRNVGAHALDLRGWRIGSGNDRPHLIARPLPVRAGATVVLARAASPGTRAEYVYGPGIALGNSGDWLLLRDPDGRMVDSVGWGRPLRGVAMSRAEAAATNASAPPAIPGATSTGPIVLGGARAVAPLVVRVLDVGQGDAILVENGGSRVLVDGGGDPARLARHLARWVDDDRGIDVVIVTHGHADHYNGLYALLGGRRAIGHLFDTFDASPNARLGLLRDSLAARARRGATMLRDADDPCGDGRATCTVTLAGGARLEIHRPFPADTAAPNNRSVPVRLVSADSSFAMWLAGDAEREAIRWMQESDIRMRADVLKANHHGSCDGITRAYVSRVRPSLVVLSLDTPNDYGYVHAQTLAVLGAAGIPWVRTDANGTVTLTAPGIAGQPYDLQVERGGRNARGASDRRSNDAKCR